MRSPKQRVRPVAVVVAAVAGAGLWLSPLPAADAAPYPPIPTTVNAPSAGPAVPPLGSIASSPTGAAAPVVANPGVEGFPGGVVAPGAFPVQAPTGAGPASESNASGDVLLVLGAGIAAVAAVGLAGRSERWGLRRRPR